MAPQVRRIGMSLRQIAFPLLVYVVFLQLFQIMLLPWL
jgi:hypothetical protein